ncbi:hypothetical protein D3C76_47740 [compost metagenome]
MAWAVEIKLPVKEKITLLMLANYASNDNGDCYPSINTLADATGMSRDSVMRAIKSLEEQNLLRVNRRQVEGVNLPNSYTLNLRGVVAVCDQGSSTQRGGVVAVCDSNLSLEPIIEPEKPIGSSAPSDDGFEAAWKAYPKREGSQPKGKAHSSWKARLKEGVTAERMLAGVVRYAAYCKAKGNVGTGYVMQAVRFFGTEQAFDNEWAVTSPPARNGKPSAITQDFRSKHYEGTPDEQFADFLQ